MDSLYDEAVTTKAQREYMRSLNGRTLDRDSRIAWELVPEKLGVLLSFIHCIARPPLYNSGRDGTLRSAIIDGDQSVLISCEGTVYGHRVAGSNEVFIVRQALTAVDKRLSVSWRRTLADFELVKYTRASNKDLPNGSSESSYLVYQLTEKLIIVDLSEEQQSRLGWEFRIRSGGRPVAS